MPVASKVKVLTSPGAPCAGNAFPLNSKSNAPTSPAFTTISFAAWMVFSVGAVKLPWRISRPSEVTKSQESECKVMRSDSGFGTAGGGEVGLGFMTGAAETGGVETGGAVTGLGVTGLGDAGDWERVVDGGIGRVFLALFRISLE